MQDLDSQEERERDKGVGDESETYEHIKNAEKFDDYVFDAATEEQIKKQASNLEEGKFLSTLILKKIILLRYNESNT